mgnify:FL=1
MKVLLDTCVLAELRHPKGSAKVKAAVEALPDDALFLSAITIGELVKGIELLKPSKKRRELANWLGFLRRSFSDRILPVDTEVAALWGELTAKAQRQGRVLHVADGLIAATAIQHGLHLMTRNVTDFEVTGALLLNPWN